MLEIQRSFVNIICGKAVSRLLVVKLLCKGICISKIFAYPSLMSFLSDQTIVLIVDLNFHLKKC